MKLFTIGDSVSQGFMSGAAARTDLSYSTLIARSMNLKFGKNYQYPDWNYHYPNWAFGGLPLNLENILRRLVRRYGSNIRAFEWLTTLQTINDVIDESEDYYERGLGSAERPYSNLEGKQVEFFHNAAAQGFDVADSWLVTPKVCKEEIALSNEKASGDGFLSGSKAAFYRTALKVLNPSLKPEYDELSQIKWLEKHSQEEGVENLLLWLGANNALGTIFQLKINQTPNDPNKRPHKLTHVEREKVRRWNLWHPSDFEAEYEQLLEKVDGCMQQNNYQDWNVFIGTVPLVTIAPLTKGVGPTTEVEVEGEMFTYYKYYTYFPFEEDIVHSTNDMYLTMQDALHIDDSIREYNRSIRKLVENKNAQYHRKRYHIVDMCKALQDLAYKRNHGQPAYKFPEYFKFIYPKVNTKYYHADAYGQLRQGGIFSLDGVHPSAIGQGLIAYEFLKVMQEVGVVSSADLDWHEIFASDALYSSPITLMQEIYENKSLAQHLIKLVKYMERSRSQPLTVI